MTGADPFSPHMETVARLVLGEPNPYRSNRRYIRFGSHGSLAVHRERGVWFDHENLVGGGVLDLLKVKLGLTNGMALDWLRKHGLPIGETISLSSSRSKPRDTPSRTPSQSSRVVASYVYQLEDGTPYLRVRRTDSKDFWQQHWDGQGWANGKPDGPKIPYRLPELLEATHDTVLVTEGEKDADNLAQLGFVTTTNPEGAEKWTPELSPWLANRTVHIVIDNDEAGERHGRLVAESLKGIAHEVRVIRLPGLGPKQDATDWIEAGGTAQQLIDLCAATPLYGREQVGFTAEQLRAMCFPSIRYAVPGLVPEGLTILSGKPKRGKSWACLEMCIGVATGGLVFGGIECEQGDVLYAALEDNPRRLQRRMRTLAGASHKWPERLTFICEMPRLKEGGVDLIRKWIEAAECPRLIVIDTLAKVRDPKGNQQSTYEADYAAVSELKALADEKGVAIVLVHHVRKMEAEDPIDTVSGTTGLTGAVDAILVLASTSQGTTLYGRGRDIEEIEKAIRFDKESCRWTIEGDASEVRRTDERSAILAALLDAGAPMSPSDLSAATGMLNLNVRQLLFKMAKAEEVVKCGRGRYRHPQCPDPDNDHTSDNNGDKVTNRADYRRFRDGDGA